MSFTSLTSISQLEKFIPTWKKFMRDIKSTNPFFSPEFARSWWQTHQNGQLNIILSYDEHQNLRGIFPMYLDNNGGLNSLGDKEVTDYYDWLSDPNQQPEVQADFEEFLKQHPSVKNVKILSASENATARSMVKKISEQSDLPMTEVQQDVCPVIELPNSWEAYLTQIGKKQRHEIKRKMKNLTDAVNPTFEVVKKLSADQHELTDFIRLHMLSSSDKAAFWTPTTEAYFRSLTAQAAEQHWLKLFFLQVNGERAAAMLCFDDGDTYYLYNSGFDPAHFAGLSVGNVLTSYTIKDAIEQGRRKYDFLRGSEEYKFRFRAVAQPIYDLEMVVHSEESRAR